MTPTAALIAAAQREQAAFRDRSATDGAAQLALIRAAVIGRDDDAWEAIYLLYRPHLRAVARRALRNNDGRDTSGDVEMLADGAFVRFWRALTPERLSGFRAFPPVYRYLMLCARSEVRDTIDRAPPWEDLPDAAHGGAFEADSDAALDGAALWRHVRSLTDDDEWHVICAKYRLGMPHRQIAAHCPSRFATAARVDVTERRALYRLRRSSALRAFLAAT